MNGLQNRMTVRIVNSFFICRLLLSLIEGYLNGYIY